MEARERVLVVELVLTNKYRQDKGIGAAQTQISANVYPEPTERLLN
jgi:hypothetical protein